MAPKRAHTSAVSVTTIGSAAKRSATAANANADRKMKTPLLTPQLHRAQQASAAPKTPSPNYFGLVVEDDDAANFGIDSDAGKHAKKNWSYDERDVPLEEDPRLENFRRQSEHSKTFKLGQALSRYNTDTRVPTLRTMNDANMSDSSPDRQPLSAGGRLTSYSHMESSEDDEMDLDKPEPSNGTSGHLVEDAPSFFNMQISSSPAPDMQSLSRHPLSNTDARNPRGSMPQTRVTSPVAGVAMQKRADTVPAQMDSDSPSFISVADLSELFSSRRDSDLLLLDLRVSPQYAIARVRGALNLCIPTTLLKRPAFNVQKLSDAFNSPQEKSKFSRWQSTSHIIVYDAASIQLKDAQACANTLKKFRSEGYQGKICIIKGGFNAVSRQRPDFIEKTGTGPSNSQGGTKLSLGAKAEGGRSSRPTLQIAGGCQMPSVEEQPANPFFGNIRQNMDLIDGVGQMAVKRPASLTNSNLRGLPSWLRDAVDEEDEGKSISDRFLKIERAEQKRMQQALSTSVKYGTPVPLNRIKGDAKQGKIQVAGIEKGTKNRYKDMLPFEHARVRLQRTGSDGCDYINASHIKPHWTNRTYIAAQAPIPTTFPDFWRLIWEQDVRVIVMLTAEVENGQQKCHCYWKPDTYGDLKIKQLSEKRVSLELPSPPSLLDPSRKASMPMGQLQQQRSFNRRATLAQLNPEETGRPTIPGTEKEPPFCIVRKLAINNIHSPFEPLREISQIVYTGWPDFGAPAEASELLGLVEEVGRIVRSVSTGGQARPPEEMTPGGLRRAHEEANKLPVAEDERPIMVHCSAGCGRTGTFVTVDSVCDMLKRQRMVAMGRRQQKQNQPAKTSLGAPKPGSRDAEINPFDVSRDSSQMMVDSADSEGNTSGGLDEEDKDLSDQEWVRRDDIDLIGKTVEELRSQRISMVQNLRQFTLCYESVLEWLVREMPERFRRENFRKSYQG